MIPDPEYIQRKKQAAQTASHNVSGGLLQPGTASQPTNHLGEVVFENGPVYSNGTWVPENDSVATRAVGLMNKNSPLMQQARTSAKKYSNRRGLMNSSMAAGAGEQAALASVLPIASQEASQAHAKNLSAISTESQERIADKNVKAHNRQYAMGSLADMQKTNLAGWTEVVKKDGISADQRTEYYEHLQAAAAKNRSLVEQMYGITLKW